MKSVQDYLEYIIFERQTLKVINERNKTKGLQSLKSIESSMVTKIIGLYEKAVSHYPEQLKLWQHFLTFCTTAKRLTDFPSYIPKWIEHHGDNADVWGTIIKWEYDNLQNLEVVRSHITEGLKRHPQSQRLHATIFRIELSEAAKPSSLTRQECLLKRVENIYQSSKNDSSNIEFFIEILTICEEYSVTEKLQNVIIKDMTEKFPSHHLTWNALAIRELKGFHLLKIGEDEDSPKSADSDAQATPEKLTLKNKIEYCVQIFKRAGSLVKFFFL